MDFHIFRTLFRREVRHLPHQKLKLLSKEISQARKERFTENHEKQVELVEKGFTKEEFMKFMSVVDDKDDYAAFMFMAILGLRVGELLALKGGDLDGDELRITSEKGSYSAVVRLPPSLLCLIPARAEHESLFQVCGMTLRRHMARYLAQAGLSSVYMLTKPCGRYMKPNKRQRFSLHSFRHFAIWQVYQETKDPDLTRRFARHKELKSTLGYFPRTRKDEVESVISDRIESLTNLEGAALAFGVY